MAVDRRTREQKLREFLADARPQLKNATLRTPAATPPADTIAGRRRRGRRRADADVPHVLNLVEEDGVLRWDVDGAYEPSAPGRRGRRGLKEVMGRLVEQFHFDPLRGSQVGSFLDGLDRDFNGNRGLCVYQGHADDDPKTSATLQSISKVPATGRILLIVHGTFSKGNAILDDLHQSKEGRAFLADALKVYKGNVLTFEHPTLSVSPILNAMDLARHFADTSAEVNVICHSRGGLVTRWWLEQTNRNARLQPSAVFVGSPLDGTSLASPARLRHALDLLTNVSFALRTASEAASVALPMFGLVAGLMRLIGSVTSAGAKTPVIDAAVAMIPGLAAQSRIRENFELERLRTGVSGPLANYSVVKAEFEPDSPGWAFWKYFTQIKDRVADVATDALFDAANDLVVDTASMNDFAPGTSVAAARVKDFGRQGRVHHLNYFAQPETAEFLRKRVL